MEKKELFNPITLVLFFTLVIVVTFLSTNKVLLAISLVLASGFCVYNKGIGGFIKLLPMLFPLIFLIVAINMLFGYGGGDVLAEFWIFKITTESISNGIIYALMMSSVILWFDAFSTAIDDEKLLFIAGGAFPNIALVAAMIVNLVPNMINKWQEIRSVQRVFLSDKKSLNLNLAKSMTTLMESSMEESFITADSMKARGFGSTKRTNYKHYSWHTLDTFSAIVMSLFIAFFIYAWVCFDWIRI